MTVWITTFLCYTALSLLIAVLGLVFAKRPPKNVNSLCGYRTKRSKASIEAWNFAQVYSGRLMCILGSIATVFTAIPLLFTINSSDEVITAVGLITLIFPFAALTAAIVMTERALKKRFEGNSPD